MSKMMMMTAEERTLAERAFDRCNKITDELESLHRECAELLDKYGWDMGVWDIAHAGMKIGRIGIGLAEAIGYDDGWSKDESSGAKADGHVN